jgi:splicing factor 3B subunit 3
MLRPPPASGGFIRLYRVAADGRSFELVHKTAVGAVPGALAPFKGRLLAGCGSTLRIYDYGKKKLLRKCEHRG